MTGKRLVVGGGVAGALTVKVALGPSCQAPAASW
jgi:hypothetical protein